MSQLTPGFVEITKEYAQAQPPGTCLVNTYGDAAVDFLVIGTKGMMWTVTLAHGYGRSRSADITFETPTSNDRYFLIKDETMCRLLLDRRKP